MSFSLCHQEGIQACDRSGLAGRFSFDFRPEFENGDLAVDDRRITANTGFISNQLGLDFVFDGGEVGDAVGTIGLFDNIKGVKMGWWICVIRR